jgi:hypothetical protein
MAKKRIQNYVFLPGIAASDNLYPNAYSLIQANKEFIKKEATAFIADTIAKDNLINLNPNAVTLLTNNKEFLKDEITAWIAYNTLNNIAPFIGYVYDADKCKRDVGYVIDAYIYDIRYGGTEQTREVVKKYWLSGVPQIDGDRSQEVAAHTKLRDIINNNIFPRVAYTSQQSPVTSTQNVSGSSAESSNTTKITSLAEIVTNVIANGLSVLPEEPTVLFPNAVTLLINNKDFLQEEITAWIAYNTTNNIPPFVGYTYDAAKCKRDVGYVLDAVIYDLSYGGNEKTVETILEYWINGIAQIDGDRSQEVAAHTKLRDIINNNILPKIAYTSQQSPVIKTQDLLTTQGEAGANARITILFTIVTDVIANGVDSAPAVELGASFNSSTRVFAQYIYDSAKCERDIGYVLDAYLNDLRYGGNAQIRFVASRYWEGSIPQIDGDRQPEIVTHRFIRDLINDIILPQDTNYVPLQTVVTRATNNQITFETAAVSRISSLTQHLTIVIQNGLSSIPSLVNGVTTIKIQGYYTLDSLLLITNTTNNQILYNFSDPGSGALINLNTAFNTNLNFRDEDFPAFLQTADYVTTITLDVDTSTSFRQDAIQIFVENKEMITRPHDFGTDAIERLRVAQPQSMLDADFEYGLQPTKWQAIGIARGYPSIYEIPGSDKTVVSVVTDASAGTDDIGQSLITVTTVSPHGFSVGTPITIRSLANTISGFSRAEGTFIVNSVPNLLTFTYYSVAKVGTSAGQVLATTYTQLREASFYTGASIGRPAFSIFSNGAEVTIESVFNVPAGRSRFAFSGVNPEVGSPLVVSGIPSGSQITSVVGDGTNPIETFFQDPESSGATEIEVVDGLDVIVGMSADNGAGSEIFVTEVDGNTITFNDPFTGSKLGDENTYTGISGTNVAGDGIGAEFTITRDAGVYTLVSVESPSGTGYDVFDKILIAGTALGGATPANDILIEITDVGESGEIINFTFSGAAVSGLESYTAFTPDTTTGQASTTYTGRTQSGTSGSGISASFTVVKLGTTYQSSTATTAGSGYAVNDTITIAGTQLDGNTPTNNATLTVTQVTQTYNNIPQSATSGIGSAATFTVTRTGTTYSANIGNNPGDNYAASDTITLDGANLGGTTSTNDATVTVTQVTKTYNEVPQGTTTGIGTGATFNVTRTGAIYSATLGIGSSQDYAVNDQIIILGTAIGGATPANDLTIIVTDVTGSGIITTFTVSGTATGTGSVSSFTIAGTASQAAGGGVSTVSIAGTATIGPTTGQFGSFDIQRNDGVYTITLNNAGIDYQLNDTLTFIGTRFAGTDPANNIIITVTGINGTGGITTFSFIGTAILSNVTYTNVIGTNVQPVGLGAVFSITRSAGVYSVTITSPGSGYNENDRILVLGTSLEGLAPTNNLLIRVSGVSLGTITTVSTTGTAARGTAITFYPTILFSDLTTGTIVAGTDILAKAIARIEIVFTTAHGLVPGATVLIDITSPGTNHDLAQGPFYVEQVPALNIIRYTVRTAGTVDTLTPLEGIVYARPDSFFIHRPYDGGVQLGTGGPQHGAQAIRMSKKYIRYQSGKGIMYTTGALFAPSYDLQSMSADGLDIGSLITVSTDDVDHGCQISGVISIIGVETAGYNGTYEVYNVINERTLQVLAQTVLANTVAIMGVEAQMSIQRWNGSTVRAGAFDDQNGMFWQYNGNKISVGLKSSTFQLAGVVSVPINSNLITGKNTRFRDQVKAGDRVVLKGMTHVVTNVFSQTEMSVTPDWRGVIDAVESKICLVKDNIIPQDQFNLDRLDGTGPSGYDLDITKMQMIGIQYSWYGAGFIDFMLRGSDGNYVYAHRIRNSNVNTEAYMRTGNLPVRYEVINESANDKLLKSITAARTTIPLVDATQFPNKGTVYIENELISFTGKERNTLTGCTRGATLTQFVGGAFRNFQAAAATTHEFNTGVVLVSNTITPIISHWGSAFLTDGRFDEDRGYLFNYAATGIAVSTTKTTAFLIRLAPSVSNAIVGDLGERELLNRAQLLLKGIEITSDGVSVSGSPAVTTTITGGIVVEGVLNPQNYPINPSDVIWSGLSGLSAGGQPSFAQVAPGGSINWTSGTVQVTADGTTLTTITGNVTVPNKTVFNRLLGTTFFYATKTSWDSLGAESGQLIQDAKFSTGTAVASISVNPAPTASVLGLITSSSQVYNGSGAVNFSAGSTVIRFNRLSWENMVNPVNSIGMRVTSSNFPANTFVTAVSGLIGSGSNTYYEVTFSNASTSFIGAGNSIGLSLGGSYTSSTALYFTPASWNNLPIDVPLIGTQTSDGKFIAGTTITSISTLRSFAGTSYYRVTFSNAVSSITAGGTVTFDNIPYYVVNTTNPSTSAVNANATVTLALSPSTIATNFVYFTKSSWENLVNTYQAGSGSEVSDAKFPAGTRVSTVSTIKTFSSTQYYLVTFNQTANTAITGGTTIGFRFGQPPYALPGETVFSFIAQPGNASSLDLSELKELTNTTLGGRGTYPNGPDILAINVYKVSGATAAANIILRWGEAQA